VPFCLPILLLSSLARGSATVLLVEAGGVGAAGVKSFGSMMVKCCAEPFLLCLLEVFAGWLSAGVTAGASEGVWDVGGGVGVGAIGVGVGVGEGVGEGVVLSAGVEVDGSAGKWGWS